MNLGMPEMLFIGLLALLIFGPKKLPEIGRQLGRGINEFKRASSGLTEQLKEECRKLESESGAENTIVSQTVSPFADGHASVIVRTAALLSSSTAPSVSTEAQSSQAERA